jgi:8-oxo-dGTP pyrophosphatase MutT (NUDIX family)
VRDGSVCLIERHRDGMQYFLFPGGGVEEGETFAQAAAREAREELGVEVELGDVLLDLEFHRRRQVYFSADVVAGTVRDGYFTETSFLDGTYRPVWVPIASLVTLDARPRELVALLLDDR